MSPKLREIQRKWVKIKVFPARPRPLSAVSQSLSQKNQTHCPKANERNSFPGQFHRKSRQSRFSLGSRRIANVTQVPGDQAQVGQDQSFSSPPSTPFCGISVSKSKKPAKLPKRKFAIVFPWAVSLKTKAITS